MKTKTEHVGHIIVARDSKLNLSTYKKVENAEYRIMKDGGSNI